MNVLHPLGQDIPLNVAYFRLNSFSMRGVISNTRHSPYGRAHREELAAKSASEHNSSLFTLDFKIGSAIRDGHEISRETTDDIYRQGWLSPWRSVECRPRLQDAKPLRAPMRMLAGAPNRKSKNSKPSPKASKTKILLER